MPSTTPAVARIEARTCVFPLERPFLLGHTKITERHYLILEVTDTDGATGRAFALTRGAPTARVITDLVGPRVIGRSYEDPVSLRTQLARSLQPHAAEGLVGRALSLIDIALWDLKGQRENAPVWKLVGGKRTTAPAMIVEGYPLDGESPIAFADRMLQRVDEGYRYLKIAYGAAAPGAFTAKLRLVMESLPPDVRVSVDAAWTWYEPEFARRMLNDWAPFNLAWVEDPVAADEIDLLAGMKTQANVPIGVGDEVARPQTLIAAASSGTIDVLRIDLTCAGGYSSFPSIAATGEEHGLLVSTHVYPELNVHSALGATTAGPVEHFSPHCPWDTTAEFVEPVVPHIRGGVKTFTAPTLPGLGLNFDQARIERATVHNDICAAKGARTSVKEEVK